MVEELSDSCNLFWIRWYSPRFTDTRQIRTPHYYGQFAGERKPTTFSLNSTRLIRTPHYYGQFAVSLGKESLYIISKVNPPNTDTPSIQTLSIPLPLRVRINGVWLYTPALPFASLSLPRWYFKSLHYLFRSSGDYIEMMNVWVSHIWTAGWRNICSEDHHRQIRNLCQWSVLGNFANKPAGNGHCVGS